MRIYGLKNCDSCKKAKNALAGVEITDVRETPLEDHLLRAALAEFGDALVNTRSTTWRGLDAAERARPPLKLLRDYPTLMKRPLVEAEGRLYLGWGKETQAALGVAG